MKDSPPFQCRRPRISYRLNRFGESPAHSCQGSHQFAARHPETAQRKLGAQLLRVLGQPAVEHFDMAERALEHTVTGNHQAVGFDHVTHCAASALGRLRQAKLNGHADVAPPTEVTRLVFATLLHLTVAQGEPLPHEIGASHGLGRKCR